MRRIAVIGSSGQLGAALCREATRRGLEWVGAARHGARLTVDLEKPETTLAVFDSRPDVVLVAAGYTFVDKAEQEPTVAERVNVKAPGVLATRAAELGVRVVYYSTDYVFDGVRDPYREDHAPSPLQVYGRTKLDGERAVLSASPSSLVLRTTGLYGQDPNGKNFVYQVLRAAREGRRLRLPSDQYGNPTESLDLAWATFELLQRGASGVFHAVGPEPLARTAFADLVCRVFGLDAAAVYEPVTTAELAQPARRPLNASLDARKLTSVLGRSLCAPEAGLQALRRHLDTGS